MNIYRRGRVWWLRYEFKGRLYRRSLKTRDKATARRLLEDILYERAKARVMADFGLTGSPRTNDLTAGGADTLPAPPAVDVAEAWRVYTKWAQANLRPNAIGRLEDTWNRFLEYAAPDTLEGITPETVERFKARLQRERFKPKTINGRLGDMRAILNRMGKLGVRSGSNPAAKVEMLKVPKTPAKFMTREDADRLLAAAQAHGRDETAFVALCMLAGFRKSEAIAARWEWFSEDFKTVTVQSGHSFRPKDSDCRTIPVSERLRATLEPYRAATGYLIAPGVQASPGVQYRVRIDRCMKPLCRAAGLDVVSPHVLRHTFASLLVQAGVSLFKVQAWLGHSEAKTTQVYAHLTAYDPDVNGGA